MTKILTIDIETSPHKGFFFGLFNQNFSLNQVETWTELMCFAAKWRGDDEVLFYSQFHDGYETMVKQAFNLVEQADAVVHFNGDSFDMPHLNREFALAKLGKPAPYTSVDLYKVAKKNFRFGSNKLDHISEQFGIGNKKHTGGFPLWIGCLNGDIESWSKMREYNKQDVVLTEQLLDELEPWITNMPNYNLYNDTQDHCVCGSTNLERRGFRYTNIAKYQRYKCNACGKWLSSSKAEHISEIRALV